MWVQDTPVKWKVNEPHPTFNQWTREITSRTFHMLFKGLKWKIIWSPRSPLDRTSLLKFLFFLMNEWKYFAVMVVLKWAISCIKNRGRFESSFIFLMIGELLNKIEIGSNQTSINSFVKPCSSCSNFWSKTQRVFCRRKDLLEKCSSLYSSQLLFFTWVRRNSVILAYFSK